MTNKVLWLISIFGSFVVLSLISLLCLLSWNFPDFADVMTRSFGGVIPKEGFVERLVCYAMLLPFFIRGFCSFVELFPDIDGATDRKVGSKRNRTKRGDNK